MIILRRIWMGLALLIMGTAAASIFITSSLISNTGTALILFGFTAILFGSAWFAEKNKIANRILQFCFGLMILSSISAFLYEDIKAPYFYFAITENTFLLIGSIVSLVICRKYKDK